MPQTYFQCPDHISGYIWCSSRNYGKVIITYVSFAMNMRQKQSAHEIRIVCIFQVFSATKLIKTVLLTKKPSTWQESFFFGISNIKLYWQRFVRTMVEFQYRPLVLSKPYYAPQLCFKAFKDYFLKSLWAYNFNRDPQSSRRLCAIKHLWQKCVLCLHT